MQPWGRGHGILRFRFQHRTAPLQRGEPPTDLSCRSAVGQSVHEPFNLLNNLLQLELPGLLCG
jgi:hypothetical protein